MALTGQALFVGDLHPDVTEVELFHLFSDVAKVVSVRVAKDPVTRRSRGYAFVNFQFEDGGEAVQNAIRRYNFFPMHGQKIQVMKFDETARKNPKCNIFIKGIEKDIDKENLHDTFEIFGQVVRARIETNHDGSSRGYGYVQYENEEAATEAIKRSNGMLLKGRRISVQKYKPREDRGSCRASGTNVYIRNMPTRVTTEEDLEAIFSKFGDITSSFLPRDNEGRLKGFGFVNFATPASSEIAISEMNGKEIDGARLYVAAAQKKAYRQAALSKRFAELKAQRQDAARGRNIYVKNLPATVQDDDLERLFKRFGAITSAKVMRDSTGVSRGFGFACFADAQAAALCIAQMHGSPFPNGKHLYVAYAKSKIERQIEIQRAQSLSLGLPMPGYHVGMSLKGNSPQTGHFFFAPAMPFFGPGTSPPLGMHREPISAWNFEQGAPMMERPSKRKILVPPIAEDSEVAKDLILAHRPEPRCAHPGKENKGSGKHHIQE
eukprot:evm.model.scf_1149.2 EVM.evm.TU.scf_1149.2   scf_1149:23061-26682(-)